jgi:hypothetical protein
MAVGNTSSGSFEFLSKLAKDAGVFEVLRNTSTMFPPDHYPEPSYIASTPVPPYISTTTLVPSYIAPAGITSNTSMDKFVNS